MNYVFFVLVLLISLTAIAMVKTIKNQASEIENKTLLIDSLKKERVGLNLAIKRQNETTQIMAESYWDLHKKTKEEAKKYAQRIAELEQLNATDKDFKVWSDADIPDAANHWLQQLQESTSGDGIHRD